MSTQADSMFTAAGVWTLLHRARPLSAKPLPKRGDAAYEMLAFTLNFMQRLHDYTKTTYHEDKQRREAIATALAALDDLLPSTQGDYLPDDAITWEDELDDS